MSPQQPPTVAEAEALAKLGMVAGGIALDAYRAGVRAGRTPPESRVFYVGDPEPDDVTAVLDEDGDVWTPGPRGWGFGFDGDRAWCSLVGAYGPVVACSPLPDYHAAVRADHERRAAAESAGGGR